MQQQSLKQLLEKYHQGNCTPDELALLESWYMQLNEDVREPLSEPELDEARQKVWAALDAETAPGKTYKMWPKLAAAASILLFLSFGAYLFMKQAKPVKQRQALIHDIAPGSNKAFITLANGKTITLTGIANGTLANQGSTHINATSAGSVAYVGGTNDAAATAFNTLSTPRGGQYALVLSDGTKVWLDAASSITYPVAFTGDKRAVTIKGQVYFEVAHNAAKPFIVTANNQTVEVLGTHFNINAYTDEPAVTTTLLEGRIKITAKSGSKILNPGNQARITDGQLAVIENADIDEVIAWHKGLFKFKEADITEVMRQLSRWYDVDVTYEGTVPNTKFSGELYRNISALKVSDVLSYEKIHFRIDGKKIIVTP